MLYSTKSYSRFIIISHDCISKDRWPLLFYVILGDGSCPDMGTRHFGMAELQTIFRSFYTSIAFGTSASKHLHRHSSPQLLHTCTLVLLRKVFRCFDEKRA